MSSPNADMIAVSLACPKDPKAPGESRRLERQLKFNLFANFDMS